MKLLPKFYSSKIPTGKPQKYDVGIRRAQKIKTFYKQESDKHSIARKLSFRCKGSIALNFYSILGCCEGNTCSTFVKVVSSGMSEVPLASN